MKKILLIAVTIHCSLFTIHSYSQPCLPEGIHLETQAQIDSFQVNYPGCTEIEGYVSVSGDNISNLDGLNLVTSIGGSLRIGHNTSGNPILTSITGLGNLTSIGEDFWLRNNDTLTNLIGLQNLTTIGGDLSIGGNGALTNLIGLQNLTTIGGDLSIGGNGALTSLSGLEYTSSIGGTLKISSNDALSNLSGIENMTSIGGNLEILYNYGLYSLTGLESIDPGSIVNITICNNIVLSTCNVQSICDYMAAPGGIVDISGNYTGCNGPNEIAEACGLPCPFEYYLYNQEQIDNFQVNNPGCSDILGNVIINGDDITNLEGLNVLTSIAGHLYIGSPQYYAEGNPLLLTLEGLDNLTHIGGKLFVGDENLPYNGNPSLISLSGLDNLISVGQGIELYNNDGLYSLSGLESLVSIGEDFVISGNESLIDLTALENLPSIGGNLSLYSNDALTSITGLESLTSIGGDLSVSGNDALTSLIGLEIIPSIEGSLRLKNNDILTSLTGLESLTSIGGGLIIESNNSLTTLSGLENLTSIELGVSIFDNESLINLIGLQNLATIGSDLSIGGNGPLFSLNGIEGLTNIGGDFWIGGSVSLVNLNGVEGLTSIGGDLLIGDNEALTNLTGLENLTTIDGNISIGLHSMYGGYGLNGNPSLTSLSGLENIEAASIDELTIIGNDVLSNCDVQSICDYLATPNGVVEIHDNATGCNNPGEIALSCGYTIPCLPFGNYYFTSQSEVDNFQTNFPDCTQLEGNVIISGDDITNLQGLSVLISVEGDLRVRGNPLLSNLSGLENLTSIGEILYIGTESLVNFSGMSGLTSIGGSFYISGNESLTNTTGIDNLVSIGGSLRIGGFGWPVVYNSNLASIEGFDNLNSIVEGIYIEENPVLISLGGFGNLNSFGEEGGVSISYNGSLASLAGMDDWNLDSINHLQIRANYQLSTCDVQSICDYLEAPNGTIYIMGNATGCNSVEEVEEACDSITSIPEFAPDNSFTIIPNPLESTTIIKYNLSQDSPVYMKILDGYGREIKTLVNELQNHGEQSVVFNTIGLNPGLYFAVLKTNEGIQTKKIIKL